MLVVPDFLLWLGVAVLVVGAADLLRRAIKHRSRLGRAVPFGVGAVALVAIAILVERHTYDVVVVVDSGHDLVADRMLTIGEPDHPAAWIYARNPTWILNRSSRAVYLQLVEPTGYDDKPTLIAPGDVSVDERIDHIGPDAPPLPPRGQFVLWLRWKR